MALIKKKTRKQLRKFMNKHGDALVTGLVGSAVAAFAARNTDGLDELRRNITRQFGLAEPAPREKPAPVKKGD